MTGHELLAALEQSLRELQALVPADKASWDQDPVVRLAVERLWITAGNIAETYRRDVLMVDPGTRPWAELAAYRHKLAHALPGDLSTDRIFADTKGDLDRLIDEVASRRP